MKKFCLAVAAMFLSLTVYAADPALQLPPNIKSLIEMPGKHDTIDVYLPNETDENKFFNKTGLYGDEKYAFLNDSHDYKKIVKDIKEIKAVEGGSLMKLNIKDSSFENFKVYNKNKTYYVSYNYAYGYLYNVKLGVIVKADDEYYLKDIARKTFEEDYKVQKAYLKEQFKDYFISAGYEEDKPFFEIFSTPNEGEDVYLKDNSVVRVIDDKSHSFFSTGVEVSFENKEINDNMDKIKAEKYTKLNEEKYKELKTIFQ